MMKKVADIDIYIRAYPAAIQALLRSMRKTIQSAAPQATEDIKYGMPTFILEGKNLVHFAAFKSHIGFYPAPSGIAAYKKELEKYKTSKGAIQFPFDQPLPLGLVKAITRYRVQETRALMRAKQSLKK